MTDAVIGSKVIDLQAEPDWMKTGYGRNGRSISLVNVDLGPTLRIIAENDHACVFISSEHNVTVAVGKVVAFEARVYLARKFKKGYSNLPKSRLLQILWSFPAMVNGYALRDVANAYVDKHKDGQPMESWRNIGLEVFCGK